MSEWGQEESQQEGGSETETDEEGAVETEPSPHEGEEGTEPV
jgi:hypothetical protein